MALKRKTGISDLVNEYKNEISLARKKFRTMQPESSKDSKKSDFSQILFYESFEHHPITLEGGFKIYPKRWALAFLQHDIKSIAEILCESLFTQAELQLRNSSMNGINSLPDTKKIAIQRAAKWLMNKFQDPWSYKPSLWPNVEEKREIEEAFQTFNWIDPKSAYYQKESDPVKNEDQEKVQSISKEIGDNKDDWLKSEVVGLDDQEAMETTTSTSEGTGCYEEILQDLTIDYEYYTAFNNAIELGKSGQCTPLGNTAQTAKLLTKMVIPDNDDIFVDAVQFSIGRWAAAVYGETVEEMVEPLFRKYYKFEFQRSGIDFKSLDDFSPPKVVALLRAVAWIKQLKSGCWDDSFGFDSTIPEHNLFPTIPEIYRIYNHLSIKYGEGPCRPESWEIVLVPEDTPPSTPVTSDPVIRSTCIVSPTPVIVTPLSPTQTQPTLQTPLLDGPGNETVPGYRFTTTVWREALRRFRLEETNGAEKAGKYLFEEIYTEDEILKQNLSGRNGKEKFPEDKMNEILNALAEMKGVLNGQGTSPLTKSERKELTSKIFVEHSNYLRRKIKENEAIRLGRV